MATDLYTRIVLTIIAASLAAIAVKQWSSDAIAQRGPMACTDMLPCVVEVRKSVMIGNTLTIGHPVEVFGNVYTSPR
jgi:hypothetical protein